MNELISILEQAVTEGKLLPASLENIRLLMSGTKDPVVPAAIGELVEKSEWTELNNRFYKTLAFGTGGLRGRTIGTVIVPAEQGKGGVNGRPEFPCVGTACMNFFNVGRAMRGLITYVRRFVEAEGSGRKPLLVIGHDTRHFSRDFAEYCSRIALDLGCDCALFDGPCSVPEVSFAIRELRADTGVMITASHNPAHDNGFKAYFNDGAQLIAPHDKAVIAEVNKLTGDSYEALPAEQQGSLRVLDSSFDSVYIERLKGIVLRPDVFGKASAKVVYTNLHGTGKRCIVPMLKSIGCQVSTVAAQDVQDGRFPTVASPNPENAPALDMAIAQADAEQADLVIATDPDCDRMGIAVRDTATGKMQLLTGNQTGCLLAWYRCMSMIELGLINESNIAHTVLVKTFVTSPLQDAIASSYGIAPVNVLTGFKYIAAKLGKYEKAIPEELRRDYRSLSEAETRALRLQYSKYFVFGGEESYGYLAQDFVRDKDANAAALCLAEMNAYLATRGIGLLECLNNIYKQFGYYKELGKSLVMEGADGAAKIAALTQSYIANPPAEMDGSKVVNVRDFSAGTLVDAEGDPIPAEKMLFFDLADGRSFAVRPSGTEPKIKYYLFAHGEPGVDPAEARPLVEAGIDALWKAIEADVAVRSC
ncbi:MAG TPA: phospho-sugar mutase [Candidatus Akkermansia intestinigallinarum]|uniref:Phospho-sugar mutase n=1 Tax=Candidatus Akkermansia intestinigallinarum TaxID=2838431 RepID=A0A9D1VC09_9BACT|nr:phospho-sugar mutase [Candidatus Akkermansia intestinigallinarum]